MKKRVPVAAILTGVMVVLYFGFISLVAYRKDFLGKLIAPGLSVGILLGALVIVVSWLLTWFYVWWRERTTFPSSDSAGPDI